MKVRIENPVPNSPKVVSNPIWLVVDEKSEPLQLKDKDNNVAHKSIEKSVRCNIGIIDYQSKEEALFIAKTIKKALENIK